MSDDIEERLDEVAKRVADDAAKLGITSDEMDTDESKATVTFQLESAPILKTLDPRDIVNFKRKLQRYRDNIKDAQVQGVIPATKSRSIQSMIDSYLCNTILDFHIDDNETDQITDDWRNSLSPIILEAELLSLLWHQNLR